MSVKNEKIVAQFETLKLKLYKIRSMVELNAIIYSTIDLVNRYAPNLKSILDALKQIPDSHPPQRRSMPDTIFFDAIVVPEEKTKVNHYLTEIITYFNNNEIETPIKQSSWKKFDVKILATLLLSTFTLWMITLFAYFNAVNTGYSTEYTKGKNAGKDENQIQINILTKEIGVLQDSILFLNKKMKEKSPK